MNGVIFNRTSLDGAIIITKETISTVKNFTIGFIQGFIIGVVILCAVLLILLIIEGMRNNDL